MSLALVTNIRNMCIEAKISVPKLEKELGFGNSAIYNWDKNSPSIDKIIQVANYFERSIDYVVYGFELTGFIVLVEFIRGDRTIEEFSKDTGIETEELSSICLGRITAPPALEIVEKIALDIPASPLILVDYLLEACNYPISTDKLEDDFMFRAKIRRDLEKSFNKEGYYTRFHKDEYGTKRVEIRSESNKTNNVPVDFFIKYGWEMLEKLKKNQETDDILHFNSEEWTKKDLEDIKLLESIIRIRKKIQKYLDQ